MMSDMERRAEDRVTNELRDLHSKIDAHLVEEMKYHRTIGERLISVETNLSAMTDYVKKVTEILERITIIEERDKSHNQVISQISTLLDSVTKQIQLNRETSTAEVNRVDRKVDKWVYTFSGGFAVAAIIGSIFSTSLEAKLNDTMVVIDKLKIHLEVDKPTGWPPSVSHP
jgi:predicted HAD superfamily Cof-like phosphohydrolase